MIDEFGDCAGMPDTYRGWKVSYEPPPCAPGWKCWVATSPKYEASCRNSTAWIAAGPAVQAAIREELIAKIDAWILENGQ